jgi:hypothetical protein
MRKVIFVFMAAFGVAIQAQDKGSIQIIAPEGFTVFLDDSLKGKTNKEEGGLIIDSVNTGTKNIRLVRDGYSEIRVQVEIAKNRTTVFKPDIHESSLTVKSAKTQNAETKRTVGTIVVRVLPVGGKAKIDTNEITLPESDAEIGNITEGYHKLTVTQGTRKVETYFNMLEDDVLTIKINTLRGQIAIESQILQGFSFVNNEVEYPVYYSTKNRKYDATKVIDMQSEELPADEPLFVIARSGNGISCVRTKSNSYYFTYTKLLLPERYMNKEGYHIVRMLSGQVANIRANIFLKPDEKSTVIGAYSGNGEVQYLQESEDKTWFMVRLSDGTIGYSKRSDFKWIAAG